MAFPARGFSRPRTDPSFTRENTRSARTLGVFYPATAVVPSSSCLAPYAASCTPVTNHSTASRATAWGTVWGPWNSR
jgi:hypothetical protein